MKQNAPKRCEPLTMGDNPLFMRSLHLNPFNFNRIQRIYFS
jgi:hypothetical protein